MVGLAWAKYSLLVQSAMKSQPAKPCQTNMATRKPSTWFTGLLMGPRMFMSNCSLLVISSKCFWLSVYSICLSCVLPSRQNCHYHK